MGCLDLSTQDQIDLKDKPSKTCIILHGSGQGFTTVAFPKGDYKIELWGSSGGDELLLNRKGGKGGYASGLLSLKEARSFYFYIGTKGGDSKSRTAGYNGGAEGAIDNVNGDCPTGGSGGATDMRTVNGAWSLTEGLNSRIMVAAGGGSAGCGSQGGNAGGIFGESGHNSYNGQINGGAGASQTSGYSKGSGQRGKNADEATGSGGGGYYGGFAGNRITYLGGAGGGGSSYISGMNGCEIAPSLIVFKNPILLSGNTLIPMINDIKGIESQGHDGDGAVRIIIGFKIRNCTIVRCSRSKQFLFLMFIVLY